MWWTPRWLTRIRNRRPRGVVAVGARGGGEAPKANMDCEATSPPWRGRPCPFSTDKDGGGLPNGACSKYSLATIKQGRCFDLTAASQSFAGGLPSATTAY